jgi:hypothetical protein
MNETPAEVLDLLSTVALTPANHITTHSKRRLSVGDGKNAGPPCKKHKADDNGNKSLEDEEFSNSVEENLIFLPAQHTHTDNDHCVENCCQYRNNVALLETRKGSEEEEQPEPDTAGVPRFKGSNGEVVKGGYFTQHFQRIMLLDDNGSLKEALDAIHQELKEASKELQQQDQSQPLNPAATLMLTKLIADFNQLYHLQGRNMEKCPACGHKELISDLLALLSALLPQQGSFLVFRYECCFFIGLLSRNDEGRKVIIASGGIRYLLNQLRASTSCAHIAILLLCFG